MSLFNSNKIKFIGHRGFQPLAPENSLPSFEYSGKLGHWAIETDLHLTKDDKIVCCHNDSIDAYFNGTGKIKDLTYNELLNFKIIKGNRVDCFYEEDLKIPSLSQYLSICKKYGAIPFIELKTDDVDFILKELKNNGFDENNTIISSIELSPLKAVRRLNKDIFVHWIFADINMLSDYAELKNCGLSLNYSNPLDCPLKDIKKVKNSGVKICLRACDSKKNFDYMQKIGLDYLPTNTMHE